MVESKTSNPVEVTCLLFANDAGDGSPGVTRHVTVTNAFKSQQCYSHLRLGVQKSKNDCAPYVEEMAHFLSTINHSDPSQSWALCGRGQTFAYIIMLIRKNNIFCLF